MFDVESDRDGGSRYEQMQLERNEGAAVRPLQSTSNQRSSSPSPSTAAACKNPTGTRTKSKWRYPQVGETVVALSCFHELDLASVIMHDLSRSY